MHTSRIHPTRIERLNDREAGKGDYVLYWMQQSQRAEHNDALEFAVQQANALERPLLAGFGLMDGYPEANLRHYRFMLEGLAEARRTLEQRGIRFVLRRGYPPEVALELGADAALIVCDRGYTRHQKQWRRHVARHARCGVVQVECDVVVPVETASGKAEFAARTIRPRLARHRHEYLVGLRATPLARDSMGLSIEGLDADDPGLLDGLELDRSVAPCRGFRGGTREAKKLIGRFLRTHLDGYAGQRNQPQAGYVSHMSKYLHFGQVSPVWLALRVRDAKGPRGDREAYLEELLVRRELAQNFVHFTPDYDRYSCLPDWARKTLAAHRKDERGIVYTKKELEEAATHDAYWNAAMNEMRYTGYMHNYMRMYWGKKIIEWTHTPEHAHRVALELNNRYFIDGRDPNSYANVNWLFGLHDRPFAERPVFGKVRYLSAEGLRRKAKPDEYVKRVEREVTAAMKAAGARD